jgi:hypothetical protein
MAVTRPFWFEGTNISIPLLWDSEAPDISVTLEDIGDFDARGMRRVYGRSDRFDRDTRNMDIWRTKGGRLLMRFWSRRTEVERESYEIGGMDLDMIPPCDSKQGLTDTWLPKAIRLKYEGWVTYWMPFTHPSVG